MLSKFEIQDIRIYLFNKYYVYHILEKLKLECSFVGDSKLKFVKDITEQRENLRPISYCKLPTMVIYLDQKRNETLLRLFYPFPYAACLFC